MNDWISRQPKDGHGQLRKMAETVGVNSVVMSQVFRGSRDLSLEQAARLSKFFGLQDNERDYFLLLVQKDRAGTHELKEIFSGQMKTLKNAAQSLQNRIKHNDFSEVEKATFYSQWYYSGVRLASSLPNLNSSAAIADRLGLDRALTAKVLDFLIRNQLVLKQGSALSLGPQVTHTGHDSSFVTRHHMNWRIRGIQSLDRVGFEDLHYTGPMALSEDAAAAIRQELVELIEKATKEAADSDSEKLRCLSIDWFGF